MSSVEKIGNFGLGINPNGIHEKSNPKVKTTFAEVLKTQDLSSKIAAGIQDLEKVWNASEKDSAKFIKLIPEEFKAIFQAQTMISKCNFQTEFATKIADAASGAIKKLSQQNN